MSRIGKLPIKIPKGVTVNVDSENIVTVKGANGELSQKVAKDIIINISDSEIIVERPSDSKEHRSFHGLYRTLISNMVFGCSEGFKANLELVGVGYKAVAKGQQLELALGYSHPIVFMFPSEVKLTTVDEKGKNPLIILQCADKQLLGLITSKIRSYRKPEPYKGKGIKFVGEVIRRKAGKSASAK
ncbi:MAG: 50S ribosomal protein L6 [Bacteroidota bacterium]